MFAPTIDRAAAPSRVRAWILILIALAVALPPSASALTPQRSAFPAPCTILKAVMRTTANGPEDESRFDTQRIQSALDHCPPGEAVELALSGSFPLEQNAFLIAPLHLPSGVILLIDAGVTVFASRRSADYRLPATQLDSHLPCGTLTCRPLIKASGAAAGFASSVSGFGTLDGRSSAPLLDLNGNVYWSSFEPMQRPDLIDATDSFNLRGLSLRDAPTTALRLSGSGVANIDDSRFVAASTGTHGIVLVSPRVRLALANSTFSQHSSALTTSDLGPSLLPLYAGAVFLSDPHATNLVESTPTMGLAVHAVVSPTQPGLPPPSGTVTFYDGANRLGEASLLDGLATLDLAALDPAHTHTLTARGDSISFGTTTAMVQPSVTSLALSASATRVTYGTPVDLTASAMPTSATGDVSFYDGAVLLGHAPLNTGAVTLTESQLTPGTHSLTAHYAGDDANSAADSPALSLRIDPVQASVTLVGVPASAAYGTFNRITASVSPTTATGTVAFSDSFTANGQTQTTSLGRATLAAGTASVPVTSLAVGIHMLTAAYSGDTNDLAALGASSALNMTAIASAVSLSIPQTTLVYGAGGAVGSGGASGSAATLSASVTPSTATGSIIFRDSATGVLGQVAIANGTASLISAPLAPGSHSISAAYSGDAAYSASTSPSITVTVSRSPSTIVLAAPASAAEGSPLPLTASVSPASASGSVTFSTSAGTTLGQAQLAAGIATLTLNSLTPGSYAISASYAGGTLTAPSQSATANTQVAANPVSITLAPLPASSPYGSSLVLTATITPASLTCLVTFTDVALGTLGSALIVNGSANLRLSNLAPGQHTLQAAYAGDASHSTAVSPSATFAITPDATLTQLTLAQTSVPAGSPVIVNVQVSNQFAGTPSGTVTIESGNRVLASGQLGQGLPGAAYLTLTVPSTSLGIGSFPLTALYNGDSTNSASTSFSSTSVSIIGEPTDTALTLSSDQVPIDSPVVLTATVSARQTTPTGSIQFLDNGIAFASAPVDASGSASVTLASPRLGSHALSAIYAPNGVFAGSSASIHPLTVTLPFALALAPATLDVSVNSTHTVALTISPLSGFSGSIQTTCTTPISFITCTVTAPSTVNGSPVDAALQITIAPHLSVRSSLDPTPPFPTSLALAALLPLVPLWSRRRLRRIRLLRLTLAALLVTASLTGCTLGGNFLAIPTGPQTISVEVVGGHSAINTTLQVNVVP